MPANQGCLVSHEVISAAFLDTKSQMTMGIIRLSHSSSFDDDAQKNLNRKQSTAKYSGIVKDVKHITICHIPI